jgi:hypothetical protein
MSFGVFEKVAPLDQIHGEQLHLNGKRLIPLRPMVILAQNYHSFTDGPMIIVFLVLQKISWLKMILVP